MSTLAISLGLVCLLEFVAFVLLYKFTRWQGKQVAFLIILVTVGLYIPYGVLTWQGLDWFAIHFAFYVMIPYVLGIITTNWEIREKIEGPARTKWFHWGPASMVVFFIVLAAVDAAIISFAEKGMSSGLTKYLLPEPASKANVTSFFPGTVSHDFQEKEDQFNQYLQERREQDQRGWTVKKGWVGAAVEGQESVFRIHVQDQQGQNVSGAFVEGEFLRPSNETLDQAVTLSEIDSGIYETSVVLPEQGSWSLVLRIQRGDDRHELRAATRIKPASR